MTSERVCWPARLPREVWIATFQGGASGASPIEKVRNVVVRMEAAAPLNPDIVCLPEVFPYDGLPEGRPPLAEVAETPIGPVCEPLSDYARAHRCYVFCPIYTTDGRHVYNALVLLDREGELVGEYRKMHPTVGEMEQGVSPGPSEPPVFQTDFGVIGAQICFDIEWDDGWQHLAEAGAEIVFWSSAFGGGRALNARAQVHKYALVSSTRKGASKIIEMTGEDLAWTGRWKSWVCASVNLERVLLHTWPYQSRLLEIEAKYGSAVRITTYHEEEWTILESRAPGLHVADLLTEFGIPTYREMIHKATEKQEATRP